MTADRCGNAHEWDNGLVVIGASPVITADTGRAALDPANASPNSRDPHPRQEDAVRLGTRPARDIVIFGAGQIADVARVYIDRHGPDRIVGFTVDEAYRKSDTFAGRPLVSWEALESAFPPDGRVQLLGPLSFRELNAFRTARYLEGKRRGYGFASFVHPSCHVYTEHIGDNCFILENNTLQPFVEIGDNVIMWSNNHIGHHSRIGDHCFLSSQVGVSSNVVIGPGCFIAGQAGIEYGVTIGANSYVGAGTVVLEDLPPNSAVPASASAVARYPSQRLKRFL